MTNETLETIKSRRSCRAYKPEQITAEELEAVTTAGTWAATAMGRQSPVMVAVQDKETLAELSRLNAAVMGTQNDPFYGAPTAVLVLGEKNNPNGVQDASLVMGNLMNAAESLGVASIWIHRAKEEFESDFGKKFLLILVFRANTKGSVTAHSDMQQSRQKRRMQEKRIMCII